ncbi:hypothetical protein BJ742DRAFT_851858 [Cladochytrium replicatum]|nr:hypothetical protein BJ742DRAFT_851858 [Cladochytrium replicatum]
MMASRAVWDHCTALRARKMATPIPILPLEIVDQKLAQKNHPRIQSRDLPATRSRSFPLRRQDRRSRLGRVDLLKLNDKSLRSEHMAMDLASAEGHVDVLERWRGQLGKQQRTPGCA